MSALPSHPPSSDEKPVPNDLDRLWIDALQRYKEETGKDPLKLSIAKDLPSHPENAEQIIESLEKQRDLFKVFRAGGAKVRGVLKLIVDAILPFLDAGAEAASNVVPGGKAVFGALGVLLQATRGVGALYDDIETLFRRIKQYLDRVSIHLPKHSQHSQYSPTPSRSTPALMNIFTDTLVQVFIALAIVTKYCNLVFKRSPLSNAMKILSRRTKDYVLVLGNKKDVADVLSRLEDLATAEQRIAVAHTNATARELQPRMKFVYDKAVGDSICSWLRPPNPQPANYEKKSRSGSCQWFIDNKQFKEWKANKRGVYWVQGNAGTGKSVLCSSVIEALREDPTLLLAYFYIDYSILDRQDGCYGLVSSLIFQLGTRSHECFSFLEKKCSSDPTGDRPSYPKLLDLLSDLLRIAGPSVIVIDAIDELPESTRRDFLFSLFEKLSSLDSDKVDLRLFVTSRPESDIRQCFMFGPTRLTTHFLDFDDAKQHREELNVYVSAQLSRSNLNRWPALKAHAEAILTEKSNGMFLWVDLQILRLKRCVSMHDIERTLKELPADLNRTYERILDNANLPNASIERARHVFEGVAFAKRLLSPAEVVQIFTFDIERTTEPRFDAELNVGDDPETLILELCPGLLDIVVSEEGDKAVQFIHFSVQEYLISADLRTAAAPACLYAFDEYHANVTLAKICLLTLGADDSLSKLHAYAVAHWEAHVSPRNEDDLHDLLWPFLQIDSSSFARWVNARYQYRVSSGIYDTAFHCAARLGLYRQVDKVLEYPRPTPLPADNISNTRDRNGRTALHSAAGSRGQVEICRLLLDRGAVFDADTDGQTPLHIAALLGHLDVVRVLLTHPTVDPADAASRARARENDGWTALHYAAGEGHTEICRMLLDCGALVDAVNEYGDTALHRAEKWGHWEVARLLFEHRARDRSQVQPLESGLKRALCRRAEEDGEGGPWRDIHEDFASQFEVERERSRDGSFSMESEERP